jgi:hypothetical protein
VKRQFTRFEEATEERRPVCNHPVKAIDFGSVDAALDAARRPTGAPRVAATVCILCGQRGVTIVRMPYDMEARQALDLGTCVHAGSVADQVRHEWMERAKDHTQTPKE